MCIQKDILDPAFLNEPNKTYLSDPTTFLKIDSNGYDNIMSTRQHVPEIEEIKPMKLAKNKVVTEYDNELKRRRQELLKKMRRSNEPTNALAPLIRKIAQSESDTEKIALTKEVLALINSADGVVPQTKFSDQMINILELCLCDSGCSDEFITVCGQLMMTILHCNIRRGDAAVVEFWCRIFDKMTNLQIEQYSLQILKMLLHMLAHASDGVIANLKTNRDTFLQNWEYFFENLCFPRCLDLSLVILRSVYTHCPDAVIARFHNVIDIMIGWCIHPDTDAATMTALCHRSVDLHDCWLADQTNLRKSLSNLQKDILNHCQLLARIHRVDKDRSQVDELKLKIKFYCFALSCVTAGVSRIADVASDSVVVATEQAQHGLPNAFIVAIIEKLTEGLVICSKQIDFDNLLLQSNTVILQLLSLLNHDDSVGTVFQTVFRYVFGTSLPLQSHIMAETGCAGLATNYHNRALLASFLDLIGACLDQVTLEPAAVVQILSPVNWVHSCLFYGATVDARLLKRYLRLVTAIARSPCVTTFYQIVLSDLELALNALAKSAGCAHAVRLVQSNAFKTKSYEPGQAELVVKYNVNVIALLHDKQQLASSSVLVPAVPLLFTKYLLFTEAAVVRKYSPLAVFIMRAVAKIQPGREHAPEFVRFLCLLLTTATLDRDNRAEAFRILQTLITVTSVSNELVNTVLACVAGMAHSDGDTEESLIRDCLSIILALLEQQNIDGNQVTIPVSGDIEDQLLRMTVTMSNHTSYAIRCDCFRIYFHLQSKSSRPNSVSLSDEIKSIQGIATSGRSFKFPMDFSRTIFHWIIECTDETSFSSRQFLRLTDLVASSTAMASSPSFSNRLVMLYEVILTACWDCVRQKLRFDPTADSRVTLVTMENMVKAMLTGGASLRAVTDKRFRKMMAPFTTKAPHDQSLSVHMLLLLLEALEKMFYNSYEGCCVGLPPVAKTTETFFVTNRQVCVEWFAKMRLLVVALAQYSGQWSTVVWHGLQLLRASIDKAGGSGGGSATRVLVPEVEDCIVLTSMAMSRLGDWESLVGLHRLAVDTYGAKFAWIDALADKTAGRLELALQKLEAYVGEHHDPARSSRQAAEMRLLTRKASSHSSFILVMEEIADCHKLLAHSAGLLQWQAQLQAWRSADAPLQEAHKSAINWDRLVCLTRLSQWDDGVATDAAVAVAPLRIEDVTWKYRSVVDHCEDVAFLSLADNSTDNAARTCDRFIGSIASLQSVCDFPGAFSNADIVLINERRKLLLQCADADVPIDAKGLARVATTLPLSVINFSNAVLKARNAAPCFANQRYAIQWHRKHRNFEKCQRLVSQSFSAFLGRQETDAPVPLSSSLAPVVQMQLERELVQLLWLQPDRRADALRLLTGSLKEGLLFETSDAAVHGAKCRLNTKSLLTLFQWLCSSRDAFRHDRAVSSNLQFLIELAEVPWINGLPLVSPQHRAMEKSCSSAVTDVCSQILILATKSHNQDHRHSDKSFMTLAQWCLNRSRSLDQQGLIVDAIDIRSALPGISPDTVANAELLLRTNFVPAQMRCEADWFGDCYEDASFLAELRSSLMALDPEMSGALADGVVTLWRDHVGQHFSLHVAAAEAYFSFLKDSATGVSDNGLGDKNKATANLRILSLLGRRSRHLRDSIIAKIRVSPPGAWVNVVPQLFARLKHSDRLVRGCMTELLQRLAVSNGNTSSGQLIIYPTLVGAINEAANPSSPYHDIKKVLVDNNRPLVDDVSVFIRELRRITVLWDELWVSSLGQCYDELNKKAHQLQAEIDKIDSHEHDYEMKDAILKLKYNSVIQPAVFILERTQAATNSAPETPRECWFHNMFAEVGFLVYIRISDVIG